MCCRKPNALVDLPEPGKEAVPAWLSSYLVALQKVCFSDHYIFTKLASVNHMVSPPTVLFMPDIALRLLWIWLGSQFQAMRSNMTSNNTAALEPGPEI